MENFKNTLDKSVFTKPNMKILIWGIKYSVVDGKIITKDDGGIVSYYAKLKDENGMLITLRLSESMLDTIKIDYQGRLSLI
jgi:hypothetical protein